MSIKHHPYCPTYEWMNDYYIWEEIRREYDQQTKGEIQTDLHINYDKIPLFSIISHFQCGLSMANNKNTVCMNIIYKYRYNK